MLSDEDLSEAVGLTHAEIEVFRAAIEEIRIEREDDGDHAQSRVHEHLTLV